MKHDCFYSFAIHKKKNTTADIICKIKYHRYFSLALEPLKINCSNTRECPFTIMHPRFWTSSCVRA